ncbi:MAG TPA: LPS assembly lipoprotein LptE [Alphaproteobacteria bacterium]|nr:LPS assembly lipoprotein LptE [Alphaproteobacteria bacterium]HQS93854.1 LPS assembly lipoprotein LptE [Alphaproteobacteria bacterium]
MNVFLILTGCGFEPLYAPSSNFQENSSQSILSKIRINLITDRKGQLLRNHLISLMTPLGQPKKPLYVLDVTVTESSLALGILKDATFSKSQMTYTADFKLKDATTGKILMKKASYVTSDYNIITNSEFATVISAQSAKDRSMIQLAQQIARELATFFFEEKSNNSEELAS